MLINKQLIFKLESGTSMWVKERGFFNSHLEYNIKSAHISNQDQQIWPTASVFNSVSFFDSPSSPCNDLLHAVASMVWLYQQNASKYNKKIKMGIVCCRESAPQASPTPKKLAIPNPNTSIKLLESSPQLPHHPIYPQNPVTGPENYQSIKYLGRGTFGDVVLAEDKQSNQQYAMKIIDKSKIKEFNVLQCEKMRKISLNDMFVTIRETFQNHNKIYIVMEYLPKGDIYFYLKHKDCIFTEELIRNLVSQIIIGIEILHKDGIIYRELKPENILVTCDGHVKLTDYGLGRMIVAGESGVDTFVGTLEYTAPEVLSGQYGMEVDIWAIGVLIFELRFARNMFQNNQFDTYEQIQSNIQGTVIEDVLNGMVGLISQHFRDVLIKLLQKNPEQRIKLEELKKHEFFKGIIWEDIPLRANQPPLKNFIQTDHIKFRDPNNDKELAHRKVIDNRGKNREKNGEFKTKLYEFRISQ